MECKQVYFSGRVQGVGFRYTARNIASDYKIGGFVRNLPDGRVELIVQGPKNQIQAFLDELTVTMGWSIIETKVQDQPCLDKFNGFEIRF